MPRPSAKDTIVKNGMEVIHSLGYHGAGIADIAAAAGVPKGSFYNHFESKEAFVAELVSQYFAALKRLFDDTLGNTSLTGLARLEALTDGLIRFVEDTGRKGCLIGILALDGAASSDVIGKAVNRHFQIWQHTLATAIAVGQADGTLTSRLAPSDMASHFISGFEGAALRVRAANTLEPLQEFKRATIALLRN